MSGFQFIHYEKYKKDDIAGIIGKHRAPRLLPSRRKCAGSDDSEREPRRTPGAAPARRSALQKTEQGRQAQKDSRRRQYHARRGFSYPDATAKRGDPGLEKWLDLSMKFIASEYGDQLHTAVLHLDESHPHVHFTSSLAIMKWLLRAEETGHQRDRQETRSQEGHAVVPRRLLQPSFRQCGHTRLGPAASA